MILPILLDKLGSLVFFAAHGRPHCQPDTSGFFFFLPPWWMYLDGEKDSLGQCVPYFTFPGDIWAVGLAVIVMLLRLAGFVAVVAIIIAGVRYMGAGGNPEKAASARKSLYNALIGLAIALTATAAVAFIGNRLGG